MKIYKLTYIICVYLMVVGCASQKTASTATGGKYSEDLSVWRPKAEAPKDSVVGKGSNERKTTQYVEPLYAVNKKLDTVLDSIDRINLSRKFIEGYTIQVYSGKREEALNMKRQLGSLVPEVVSEIQFAEPVFRVKAGKYFSRLDAQKDFSIIKKHFPTAIIIPDRIAIN